MTAVLTSLWPTIEGMSERSVTISGMSKTYAVTGWRVGTIIAPPKLTHAFRQVHDFVSIGAAAPLAGGRRGRVSPSSALLRPARRRIPGAARPLLQGPLGDRLRFRATPRSLLHHGRHRGLRRHRRRRLRSLPGPRHRRRHRTRLELLSGQGARTALRSLLLLQT